VSWDPYLDLDSGVLRNRLGIIDPPDLAQAEAVLTASRIYDLERSDLPGSFDLAHLRAFHRHIFGDLYDWAGELRTVSIGRGSLFCLPEHLGGDGEELFAWLARTGFLRDLDRDAFVHGLTALLSDLNALHPFRDGNGRTQRAFVAQLARSAGHPVRWSAMDPAENIAACRAAHEGDDARLHAMLDKLVGRQAP
jgi:cell filamentation protein